MSDISAAFGAGSSLVSGLFGYQADTAVAAGDTAAAQAYATGAEIAGQDVNLAEWSTRVQEIAAARKVQKTIGAENTATAASGFATGSGTAGELLRESTTQGNMTQQMLGIQGSINANNYLEQQAALTGESQQATAAASAAQSAAEGSLFGGILGAAGKLAGMFF